MCLEIFPNTGHILNPKCLNYALEELQPIPNRNTVVCLQAMKLGLEGVIMCCKCSELRLGLQTNPEHSQAAQVEGAGWIRAAQPSPREMRILHPNSASARRKGLFEEVFGAV